MFPIMNAGTDLAVIGMCDDGNGVVLLSILLVCALGVASSLSWCAVLGGDAAGGKSMTVGTSVCLGSSSSSSSDFDLFFLSFLSLFFLFNLAASLSPCQAELGLSFFLFTLCELILLLPSIEIPKISGEDWTGVNGLAVAGTLNKCGVAKWYPLAVVGAELGGNAANAKFVSDLDLRLAVA